MREGSASWAALLDAIDAGLEFSPPVVVDYLSAEPGPLPPALRDRAVSTFRRMAEAEAELAAQQAEIARELIGLSAARTASAATAAAVPHFLDARI